MSVSTACPGCTEQVALTEVQRNGILHCRVEAKGGPYYTLGCPHCRSPLVAELSRSEGMRLRGEKGLRGYPALLRSLRDFLAAPQRGRRKTPAEPAPRHAAASKPVSNQSARSPQLRNRVTGFDGWTRLERESLRQLGLRTDIQPAEVRVRYREFVKQSHPDRFAGSGRRSLERAEREFIQRNEMFRRLMRRPRT
jgi:hypothetical protein